MRWVKYEYVTETVQVSVSRYLRDPAAAPGQGYVSVAQILTEPAHVDQALVREFTMALGALRRACRYAQAFGLSRQAEQLIRDADRLLTVVRRRSGNA
jgi:hypothetical protein